MKEYVKVSISLALVCGIVTFLLSFVNSFTAPKIEEATNKKAVELCSKVYEAESFTEKEVPDSLKDTVQKIYLADDGGYVIAAVGKGYGGDLVVMVGIRDGQVTGTVVLTSGETQNIGTKVESDSFASQFKNKDKTNHNDADTITGATISSTAYKNAVGYALSAYDELKGDIK